MAPDFARRVCKVSTNASLHRRVLFGKRCAPISHHEGSAKTCTLPSTFPTQPPAIGTPLLSLPQEVLDIVLSYLLQSSHTITIEQIPDLLQLHEITEEARQIDEPTRQRKYPVGFTACIQRECSRCAKYSRRDLRDEFSLNLLRTSRGVAHMTMTFICRNNTIRFRDASVMHTFLQHSSPQVLELMRVVDVQSGSKLYLTALDYLVCHASGKKFTFTLPRWISMRRVMTIRENFDLAALATDAEHLLQLLHAGGYLGSKMEFKEKLRRLRMLWFYPAMDTEREKTSEGNKLFQEELGRQLLHHALGAVSRDELGVLAAERTGCMLAAQESISCFCGEHDAETSRPTTL